jgi:hypothetical protein
MMMYFHSPEQTPAGSNSVELSGMDTGLGDVAGGEIVADDKDLPPGNQFVKFPDREGGGGTRF